MATSEVAPRRAVRPSERVRHLRAADAGLPLLSRAGSGVGACACGLTLRKGLFVPLEVSKYSGKINRETRVLRPLITSQTFIAVDKVGISSTREGGTIG